MNDAEINLINKTFYPGWLMVSQLRSGQEIKDGEALYRRACRWVNAARESLTGAGFSTVSCDHMLYAYCALLDESVLNRDIQDDGYRQWRKDPLQARFFRTLNAGEELWERTAHQLITILSAVLLKYEPRLSKITVVMQEQTQPGELRYAIDAELKGIGLVRYGTEFMPEGKVLIRHLKQQQYLDTHDVL